jgi:hypothetical protein
MKTAPAQLLHEAMILGRVERLLGNDLVVNPYPATTRQWLAFRSGWLRPLTDPISQEMSRSNDNTLQP